MNALFRSSVLGCAALLAVLTAGCAMNSGTLKRQAALRDEWIDPATGHRVVRLSRMPGASESFYFHQNAYTATGDKMVFARVASDETRRLFTLDLRTRAIEELADRDSRRSEVVAPRGRRVYYLSDGDVCATHLDTHETRIIARLPRGWGGLTVNADETLLAGAYGEGAYELVHGRPRSYWFTAIQEAHLPYLLFTVEIATGKTNAVYRCNDWLNHIQFSPTDPALLMFCHEGPWHKVDRIWNIRTDGSGLKLMHRRSVTNEIAGHEFWSPDGRRVWFDLQIPRGETFFLAGVDVATGEEIRYPVERNQWSVHFNISHDGKMFAGDGGATNMVARAPDGKWIWLFRPQPDGTLRAERLCSMVKHDYSLEPNVNFTTDNRWVVFRGNFDGSPQVYAVELEKAK